MKCKMYEFEVNERGRRDKWGLYGKRRFLAVARSWDEAVDMAQDVLMERGWKGFAATKKKETPFYNPTGTIELYDTQSESGEPLFKKEPQTA